MDPLFLELPTEDAEHVESRGYRVRYVIVCQDGREIPLADADAARSATEGGMSVKANTWLPDLSEYAKVVDLEARPSGPPIYPRNQRTTDDTLYGVTPLARTPAGRASVAPRGGSRLAEVWRVALQLSESGDELDGRLENGAAAFTRKRLLTSVTDHHTWGRRQVLSSINRLVGMGLLSTAVRLDESPAEAVA